MRFSASRISPCVCFPCWLFSGSRPYFRSPVQLLLSVSKRRFKRAVRRNRTKRLLREAYRRQKHLLRYQPAPGRGLNVAFMWLSDALMTQAQVDAAVAQVLERMSAACQPV